jgi:hypothetical protein
MVLEYFVAANSRSRQTMHLRSALARHMRGNHLHPRSINEHRRIFSKPSFASINTIEQFEMKQTST